MKGKNGGSKMLEARSPDITRIAFRGAYYEIWDAFPSIRMAEQTAEDMRQAPYPNAVAKHRCKAVTVDLGPAAGRLRYGVFIAKGARM